jgi:hypothetical protein
MPVPGMPLPSMPSSPMGTAPAMPGQVQSSGKEARGKVIAGLGLEMLRIAIPLLGNTPDGLAVVEVVAKLGKKFAKPAADLQKSELTFMQSQLGGGGGPMAGAGAQGPQAPPQMPAPGAMPAPPAMPMAA